MRSRSFLVLVLTLASASACKAKKKSPTGADAAAAAGSAVQALAKQAANAKEAARRRKWAQPSGPSLAVQAGLGIGAIRLGATVGTIERLMDKPCEVKTEELCRYVSRGVDFRLEGGYTTLIHVQRAGRPAGVDFNGEPLEFGFFNGAIPPDLRLGMVPKAIQEYLGPPERIEPVPQPNPASIVARDYYPGMVIEYDRYTNGKIIMGGIQIMKDPYGRAGYEYEPPASPTAASAVEASGTGGAAATRAAKRRLVR
jgi:hypothetical protein